MPSLMGPTPVYRNVFRRLPQFRSAAAAAALLFIASCGGNTAFVVSPGLPGNPNIVIVHLSSDPFTNSESQHATEVEPGMAASGSTLVTAFQVGRNFHGGAAAIGFATSTDGGATWSNGLLPAFTQTQGGPYVAGSDASVAYDQAHGVWLVSSLAITSNSDIVVVSRSGDAHNWTGPAVVSTTPDADKNWITCDNNANSRFFGHCYVEWDDPSRAGNGIVWMSTSSDGGVTWSPALNTADSATGLGGQPVVGGNGLVVVPILSADGNQMLAFTSSDGGASWSRSVVISNVTDHTVAGGLRNTSLPSAAVDSSGRVYLVWQDCRFRTNCASNDIVMSTSADGSNWTDPVGIPIDATSSTVDHFIPALAVDPMTSGSSARLALTYYFYPNAGCTAGTCQLEVGSITSSDGGTTWSAPTTLAGPMTLSWLPNTTSGLMVADYIATAFANGQARAVFAVAQAKSGSTFNQTISTTQGPLPRMSEGVRPVMASSMAVTRRSDHGARRYLDLDHEHLRPPRKRK